MKTVLVAPEGSRPGDIVTATSGNAGSSQVSIPPATSGGDVFSVELDDARR